ncbi:zinc-dependent alcohol dehydrogenase family protein [bacterium]|nr:zinc-dependent alcohol dehydrogenase family protein [candidate division CSSED10-310 bacterium]
MKAMILKSICDMTQTREPLEPAELPDPSPGDGDVLVRVNACGVCHTELDEIEGRTPPPFFPMVLGHQVVGTVTERGSRAKLHGIGDRVGIAWIYSSCGRCSWCRSGDENLCPEFQATGRDAFGGYAQYMVVPESSAFKVPGCLTDYEAAPLLCAGAIGYRSLRLTGLGNGQALGLTGFGASAHLVLKMVRYRFPETRIHVFARSASEREFARDLGAVWAGDTAETAPEPLDAIIDTTPVWKPVVEALRNLAPGGRLVINAIRKESVDQDYLLKLDYPEHLWMEKEIKSVANVAKRDVAEFLELAADAGIHPEYQLYDLDQANTALMELKKGIIRGAKILVLQEVKD